ncbi:MAG: DnaB-like helicase N-terminal domain-containing protein [Thermotogota bacterium]|nr:DnaB-like helicase N-terminal domain-containing protein [Thermotogota bacterium]
MNTNTDKAFPQNREAEESLLSAILHDNNILDDVLSIINSEDFYNHKSQKIFSAMVALFQTGEPIDLITLSESLAKNGSIKQVGGAYALSRLVDQVPLAVNPVHYAKIVKEKSILRKLIFKSKEILDNCYQNKTIDDILDFAERAIYDLSENRNLSSVSYLEEMDQNIEDLINRSSGSLTGVPSGFSDLDKITLGLQPGELIILAGRPSMGKTAFALNIAKNAAKKYYTPRMAKKL